ncbi:Formin-like protein 8 [Abeliophyllum distichum]|uniref:Formin-like protein n=1 Tax=Abeliophyllum distichum TaxID=126358 RepID=A0ABD1NNG7_9LAMI
MTVSQNGVVVKAVAATAVCSFIIAGFLFYFFYRLSVARQRKKNKFDSSFRREDASAPAPAPALPCIEFRQQGGAVKGVIVEEDGLDVLYLRKVERGDFPNHVSKVWYNNPMNEKSQPIQEIPLLHLHSHDFDSAKDKPVSVATYNRPTTSESVPHPSPPPLSVVVSVNQITPAPPVALPPPPPPPPPPLPNKRNHKPAPPPPSVKAKPSLPPPPVKSGVGAGSFSPLKPPIPPKGKTNNNSNVDAVENTKENDEIQTKLKPLHWDKVVANADHSMVWDEINDGSFRFDDELMENLFGYTTTRHKSAGGNGLSTSSGSTKPAQPAQIFILEPWKSQNKAIILKSLAISRKEIIEALVEGRGLNADTLEKLTKICPSEDEIAKILQFNGNPAKLADAESFLFHILKAIPSAFTRFNAMLFRSTYDPEILHLKESLQTLELGCKELRTPGIFFKLLEAILKAGNRMNAGTARGNAQGFNLSALLKLSDVKSTNGKTTLLQFVVEQVIRSQGKRRWINQNDKPGDTERDSGSKISEEERDEVYLMQGLPVVLGLSTELANVKKSATIDHDSFINMSSTLTAKIDDIKRLITRCRDNEKGRFFIEIKGFLEDCEEELNVVRDEQSRVMELVKKTTVYYQAGGNSKERGTNPLQLFVIVNNFLDMVDQVCVEISKKLQKKKQTSAGSSPPLSPLPRSPVRFPSMQPCFRTQNPGTFSNDSDDDF